MKQTYSLTDRMFIHYSEDFIQIYCSILLEMIIFRFFSHLGVEELWYAHPITPQYIMAIYDYDLDVN